MIDLNTRTTMSIIKQLRRHLDKCTRLHVQEECSDINLGTFKLYALTQNISLAV